MKRKTTEEFILECKIKFGDKFDYSKTVYVNALTNVCIICPEHGEFWQNPRAHLRRNGCPECAKKYKYYTQESFIEKAKKVHNSKYLYDHAVYTGGKNDIIVTCPIHGDFQLKAYLHLQGQGCPKCASNYHYDTREFIEKAKKIHGDKYDYSKVLYVNCSTKICIICLEHGEFWLTPDAHLLGLGCPKCNCSHGEAAIEKYLKENNIKYISLYLVNIPEEINPSGKAYIDFYLPEYNLFIEYNGRQHYIPIEHFGGELKLQKQQRRDNYIKEYCKYNNIGLLEIKYDEGEIETILNKYFLIGNIYNSCTTSSKRS